MAVPAIPKYMRSIINAYRPYVKPLDLDVKEKINVSFSGQISTQE
jgi:hypothetical protein